VATHTASASRDAERGEEDDDKLCVVCTDAPKDHAIMPCCHICVCGECAARLLQVEPD
jgi:hypothetical protein